MPTGVQSRSRAPRFTVPNNELAVISVGAEKLSAILNCLSLTGGRIRLSKRFPSGTFADIQLKTVSGKFTAAIELLAMVGAGAQAFRFVQMAPGDRHRLEDALGKMKAQGLGEKQSGAWNRLLKLTRGVLPVGR